MRFLINWLVTALAVAIVSYLLPGVSLTGAFAALVTALVLGLVNAFIRPILLILTLPLTIVTLGLFTLVINAFMVVLTAAIVPGFIVASFWWALLFSLVLALVNWALSALTP
jgi:putative membrane protein